MTPVPNKIYGSQPRCESSRYLEASNAFRADHEPAMRCPFTLYSTDVYVCPSVVSGLTLPYEPILAVPMEVRDIDPAWRSCIGGIDGAYDPPKALLSQHLVAGPTTPTAETVPSTTTAAPALSATPTGAPSTTSVTSTSERYWASSTLVNVQPSSTPALPPLASDHKSADDWTATTKNALSILSDAESSLATWPPQDPFDDGTSVESPTTSQVSSLDTAQPAPTRSGADPVTAVVTGLTGDTLTVVQSGSVVAIAHSGSFLSIPDGGWTVLSGHTYSAASLRGTVMIDGLTLELSSASALTSVDSKVLSESGQAFTASRQGSSVIVAEGGQSVVLSAGDATTFHDVTL